MVYLLKMLIFHINHHFLMVFPWFLSMVDLSMAYPLPWWDPKSPRHRHFSMGALRAASGQADLVATENGLKGGYRFYRFYPWLFTWLKARKIGSSCTFWPPDSGIIFHLRTWDMKKNSNNHPQSHQQRICRRRPSATVIQLGQLAWDSKPWTASALATSAWILWIHVNY